MMMGNDEGRDPALAGAIPARVLLVAMEWTPNVSGGVGTYVYELAHGLARHGCEVTVLAYTPGQPKVIREPGLEVHLVPPSPESLAQAARLTLVGGIQTYGRDLLAYAAPIVAARRPQIVHFHQWHTRAPALALAQQAGVPVVGTCHHLTEPAERWWGQAPDPEIAAQERILFTADALVITVSHSMKHYICATYPVAPERVHVIHCGLDVAPFRDRVVSAKALARLRASVADPDDAVVLYTGRIHPQKGIPAIYAAAARVLAQHPRVTYLLAGGTDSRASTRMLEQLTAEYGAHRARIKVLGKLPREQLPLLHRIADFALVPSVYEPFGFTAVETMASGTPVIVSDEGGLAEIVEHGVSGLKVPVVDAGGGQRTAQVEALVAAQLELLADPERTRVMGQAAQRRVEEAFTIEQMVRGNLDVYAAVAQARQATVSRGDAIAAAAGRSALAAAARQDVPDPRPQGRPQ
jgi:glycosyltransferase involved in cell wall biosynthesis